MDIFTESIDGSQNPDLRSSSRKRKSTDRYLSYMARKRRKPLKKSTNKKLGFETAEPSTSLILPQFDLLPSLVWRNIIRFLDVRHIGALSCTCWSLYLQIKDSFITTVDFPFNSSFITQLKSEDVIEKKPLLQLRCLKSRFGGCPVDFRQYSYYLDASMHWFMMATTYKISSYLVRSQLSLLQLSMLRELHLVPLSFKDSNGQGDLSDEEVNRYLNFDSVIMETLDSLKVLPKLSRLAVLQDHQMDLKYHVGKMSSLVELVIFIMTRDNLRHPKLSNYTRGVECVVRNCRAKALAIVVLKETRRKVHKMLVNPDIECLHIRGPCTFNALLEMKNLKDLSYCPVYKFGRVGEDYSQCRYWSTKPGDRNLHRDGLCCVDFSSVLKWCPALNSFGPISLLNMVGREIEAKWMAEARERFFQRFISIGGNLPISTWARQRWVKKTHMMCLVPPGERWEF